MFGQSFSVGQHVVVRRDVDGWLGYPAAKRGARAIVRERPYGLFSDHYLVELSTGRRLSVGGKHLKPALYGYGDEAWRRYKANRVGVRIGMAVLALPAVIEIVRFYLAGGTTAELIAALPSALLDVVGDVVGVVDRLGLLPLVVVGLAALFAVRRFRSR